MLASRIQWQTTVSAGRQASHRDQERKLACSCQFSTKENANIFLSKLFHLTYCSLRTTTVWQNSSFNITYGHSLTSRKKNGEVLSPCLFLQQFWLVLFFFSLTFGYSQLISSILEQRQFQLLHNYSFKLLPFIYQIFTFSHFLEKHFFGQTSLQLLFKEYSCPYKWHNKFKQFQMIL